MAAANSTEHSYACCFSKKLETYVADLFSLNWIKYTAAADTADTTILQEFKSVKVATNRSTVTEYGELVRYTEYTDWPLLLPCAYLCLQDISEEPLGNFMGAQNSEKEHNLEVHMIVWLLSKWTIVTLTLQGFFQLPTDAVPSGDVPIAVLSHLIFETDDEWQKEEYERKLAEELMVGTLHGFHYHSIHEFMNTYTWTGEATNPPHHQDYCTESGQRWEHDQHTPDCEKRSHSVWLYHRCGDKVLWTLFQHQQGDSLALMLAQEACSLSVLLLFPQLNYASQLLFTLVNLCEAYPTTTVTDAIDLTCHH